MPRKKELLNAQEALVYRYVLDHICDRKRSPSATEIGRFLGLSRQRGLQLVNECIRKGHLRRVRPGSRFLVVVP